MLLELLFMTSFQSLECSGSPLPWDSTLEQLGFGESPELRLKERVRSRPPSRSSSFEAVNQITLLV